MNTELVQAGVTAAADAEDNVPCHSTSLSAAAEVALLKCERGSTYPGDRGSYWNMTLGCRSTLGQMMACYCMLSVTGMQGDPCLWEGLEMAFSARSRRMQ